MIRLNINGAERQSGSAQDTPLLWVLRDELNLTGTKFGCGVALCGACTVHVDGVATRSCVTPASSVVGKKVRTIEGLAGDKLSVLQSAWISHQVPQCGYCQSGMLMAASALLAQNPAPTDADIDKAVTNICRCGTYQRIRAAIHAAARSASPKPLVEAVVSPAASPVGGASGGSPGSPTAGSSVKPAMAGGAK